MGNREDALKYYHHALQLDESFYITCYNIGIIHFESQKYNLAIDYFQKTIEIEPNYYKAWFSLGICFIKIENVKYGYECIKYAYKLNPNEEMIRIKRNELKVDILILKISKLLDKFNNSISTLTENLKSIENDPSTNPINTLRRSLKPSTCESLKMLEHKIELFLKSIQCIINRNSDKKVRFDNVKLCVICAENERENACIPCGHLCLCNVCSKKILHCPLCRKDVESFIHIYV